MPLQDNAMLFVGQEIGTYFQIESFLFQSQSARIYD